MIKLSVIICSHNPRATYLSRTLRALQSQRLPKIEWELLLIDNASAASLAQQWDLSWHPHARHIFEDKLGLTPARLRGIREARGDLLLFVDDDNVLDVEYLAIIVDIASKHSHLGVFGAGVLEPEFEIPPPQEVLPLTSKLALRFISRSVWTSNAHDTSCIPWGAGLCVRRFVALRYLTLVDRFLTSGVLDRRGGQLFCGGDDLFSWVSVGQGYGFGLFRELRLRHLINQNRLNQPYFIRLIHDHAFSHAILRYLVFSEREPQKHLRSTIRTILHGIRRGRFAMRCRWAAVTGARRAALFIDDQKLVTFASDFFPSVQSRLPQ